MAKWQDIILFSWGKCVAWICLENILLILGLVMESALQKFPRKICIVVPFWINSLMAVLGLHCCVGATLCCSAWALGAQAACSMACEIFPDQASNSCPLHWWASLVAQRVKNLPAMQETQVQSLGWHDCLGKEMATHSSILAWRIPWTEESGGLQSRGSLRVGHNWATNTPLHWQVGHLTTELPGKSTRCPSVY